MEQGNTIKTNPIIQLPAVDIWPEIVQIKPKPDGLANTVPFWHVEITDRFWANRINTNRIVTIPSVLEKCRQGRIANFANVAANNNADFIGIFYDDSDLYKVIEGIAYSLTIHPDPKLENTVDDIIDEIAGAQWSDGYLNTYYSLPDKNPENRWTDLEHKHELYCAGHLIEAAIGYYHATGKTKLLDVASKFISFIHSVFGKDKKIGVPGHQELELALIKLYRLKKDKKHLELAKFFLEERGNNKNRKTYGTYAQDHKPITEQTEAVGHTVRAMYMYCAMADVDAESPAPRYHKTLIALWENIVTKKMYITGGIGSRHEMESFGVDYELPNKSAYSETCAAIGNIMWNHRMFLLEPNARYIDIIETTLYNIFAASTAISGDKFFYVNPLESDGKFLFNKNSATHQTWFDCSCCPTNIVRFVPKIAEYIYALGKNELFINLYIASKINTEFSGQKVNFTMATDYPTDENIQINVEPESETKFTIKLRIPCWSQNSPLPEDLYRYLDNQNHDVTISINGQIIDYQIKNGYAIISRIWCKGDRIEMTIPMPVRLVLAHEKAIDNHQKVALQRGPIVYCVEEIDNIVPVSKITISKDAVLEAKFHKDLFNGLNVISGNTQNPADNNKTCKFAAIPYYAWAHRGTGQMTVWLNRD
ncbi:MAG: glycoside hydrolase family 127 protein [Phycisphaerae bacterium]|nr:glycoside hydrolase family 127 protein [Phycisphaerae bacterium]